MFTPYRLTRNVQLSHRIVMAPLTRTRALNEGDVFTDTTAVYYGQRASKGGLLISEATFISPVAKGFDKAPGIHTPAQKAMWKPVTSAVHAKGGYIYMQLWHMGRQSHSSLQISGSVPVAPSPVASSVMPVYSTGNVRTTMEVPHALTREEILATVQDYYAATIAAKEAGFDGVEIHDANGYLLQQFLSTNVNQRTDEFGGSIPNRCRFTLLVVDAVTRAWLGLPITASQEDVAAAVTSQYGAAEEPVDVGIRFSPYSTFGDVEETDGHELYVHLLGELNKRHPLAYVHLVEPRASGGGSREMKEGEVNNGITLEFRPHYKGTFISAGGYSYDPYSAEETLKSGSADLIAIGRAFITNPDLPERLKERRALREWNRDTFYVFHPTLGYTDQPTWEEEQQEQAVAIEGQEKAKTVCC